MQTINPKLVQAALAPSLPHPPVVDLSKTTEVNRLKNLFVQTAREIEPDWYVRDDLRQVINDIFLWCIMADGPYNPNKGLFIWGNIGTGKSTMLEIILRFCAKVRPHTPEFGAYGFRITKVQDICDAFADKQDGGSAAIQTFITSRRQAFDELGSESIPTICWGNAVNVMQNVLQARYDRRRDSFTHITTNLMPMSHDGQPNEIVKYYGERVWDRCKEMFNFVHMPGKSFRKK